MKTKPFVLTAIFTATLASACCILPLVAATLGLSLGALGGLSVLAPYRWLFVVLTLALLGFAFYKVYRGADACGPDGSCAMDPSVQKRNRILLWCIAVIALGLILFPYFLK